MKHRNLFPAATLAVAALLWSPDRAAADAIDGNWCSDPSGRQMSIDGPRIVTPGGVAMQGNYSRHAFRFVVPAVEQGAGAQVSMVLVNDDTIHLRHDQSALEVWRRCEFVS